MWIFHFIGKTLGLNLKDSSRHCFRFLRLTLLQYLHKCDYHLLGQTLVFQQL